MSDKFQPWKAYWPPQSTTTPGETHGFQKGELLQLEGSAGAHPPPSEGKIQPWKAHWPPTSTELTGESHGFGEGQVLRLEGSAGAHPPR
jgi:hypothetical protein